jgi:hypothetical protein
MGGAGGEGSCGGQLNRKEHKDRKENISVRASFRFLCVAWFVGEKRRRAAALQDAGAMFGDAKSYAGYRIT